ncbi:hypothetical protein FHS15_001184 [Paenibacillus castaneae]|uniref:lasso peptide biosynthesis PqqD family chaperone n=1 Tax=Paenibacillus castaneae TaxID=474957 RepID=UPI000C9992A4|nr:lasso peptide biosynthesis PqqD family chaperone [Paenibacillus castaneae]NIK76077.1 hypothetical protein [Paenibacillus castaneae]
MIEKLKSYQTEIQDFSHLLGASVFRDDDNIVSDMGNEKVILSVKNGKYYNLGNMGSQIWDFLQSPIVITDLIDKLTEHYDVERLICEEQLLPFLQHLSEENLIHIHV